MFQFTRLLLHCLWIQQTAVGYPGIIACLSTPPGFSQTSTPFSFRRLGIPHVPFVIWPSKSRTRHPATGADRTTPIPRHQARNLAVNYQRYHMARHQKPIEAEAATNTRWRTESSTESSYQPDSTLPARQPRKPGIRTEQSNPIGNASQELASTFQPEQPDQLTEAESLDKSTKPI